MRDSTDAPLSRSQSDTENLSLRQYIDLRIIEIVSDVKARREGMANEELSYREGTAAEERSYRDGLASSDAQWRRMHEKVHDELEKLAKHDKETGRYIWETAQNDYRLAHVALEKVVAEVRANADRALRDAMEAHAIAHTHLDSEILLLRQQSADSLATVVTTHQSEHERAREADLLADKKLDIRLDDMNGLRAQITAAQQGGVTRDQLDDRVAAVAARVEAAQATFNQAVQRLETAIVDLQTSRATAAGRATALSTMIGIGTFFVSVSVAIVLHFVKS